MYVIAIDKDGKRILSPQAKESKWFWIARLDRQLEFLYDSAHRWWFFFFIWQATLTNEKGTINGNQEKETAKKEEEEEKMVWGVIKMKVFKE